MRKNRWYYYDHSLAWQYSWVLNFDSSVLSSIELIIDVSGQIIELFHKYEIACFFSPKALQYKDVTWVVENYKKNARLFFIKHPNALTDIGNFNFTLDIWSDLGKSINKSPISYHDAMTKTAIYDKHGCLLEKYIGTNNEIVSQALGEDELKNEIMGRSPLYLNFGFSAGTDSSLFFLLDSQSDIWFEDVPGLRFGEEKEDGSKFDNRPIAYRITPRLNSLLKGLTLLGKRYNAMCKLNDPSLDSIYIDPDKLSAQGVLLDNKIIYQEDIEEGRVKMPK